MFTYCTTNSCFHVIIKIVGYQCRCLISLAVLSSIFDLLFLCFRANLFKRFIWVSSSWSGGGYFLRRQDVYLGFICEKSRHSRIGN